MSTRSRVIVTARLAPPCAFFPLILIDYLKILYGVYLPDGDALYFYPIYISFANNYELANPFMSPIQEGGGPLTWHGWLQPMLLGQMARFIGGDFFGARFSEILIKYIGLFFFIISCNSVMDKNKFLVYCGLVIAYVAFDSFLGRPELLSALIILVWLYFYRLSTSWWSGAFLSGITLGLIAITQPTVAGLSMCMLFFWKLDTLSFNRKIILTMGVIVLLSLFISISMTVIFYPYHMHDLLMGIMQHAALLKARGDTDKFLSYWFLSPTRPMHGLIIFVSVYIIGAGVLKKSYNFLTVLAFIMLLFIIWYFSIRIPAANYNVMAFVPIFVILGVLHIAKNGAFSAVANFFGACVFVSSFAAILISYYTTIDSFSISDLRKQLSKYGHEKIEVPLPFLIGAVPFSDWQRFVVLKDEESCPFDFDTITLRQQANKGSGVPVVISNCILLENNFKVHLQLLGQRVLPSPKDYRNSSYVRIK